MSTDKQPQEIIQQTTPKIDVEKISLLEAINAFKRIIKNDNSVALRKLLDKRDDIDVNLNGGWPLIYSIENDCFKVFKVLVRHPDINLNIRNSLPLLVTIQDERFEYFKYLLRHDVSLTHNVMGILNTVKMCSDGRFRASLIRHNFQHFFVKYPTASY